MTKERLNEIILALKDCNDYLDGRTHSRNLQAIARTGAEASVREFKETLLLELSVAGLYLED